mmetsp:Transcript_21814/g.56902  ORF Transcript_21814/g.56902 Transcript_21814/m.56902 type:complete len:281 (-) Transcript_21814:1391-2233(-)
MLLLRDHEFFSDAREGTVVSHSDQLCSRPGRAPPLRAKPEHVQHGLHDGIPHPCQHAPTATHLLHSLAARLLELRLPVGRRRRHALRGLRDPGDLLEGQRLPAQALHPREHPGPDHERGHRQHPGPVPVSTLRQAAHFQNDVDEKPVLYVVQLPDPEHAAEIVLAGLGENEQVLKEEGAQREIDKPEEEDDRGEAAEDEHDHHVDGEAGAPRADAVVVLVLWFAQHLRLLVAPDRPEEHKLHELDDAQHPDGWGRPLQHEVLHVEVGGHGERLGQQERDL